MVADVALRKITFAEFRQMEFDDDDPFQYELLDGDVVQKSSPNPYHQRASREITVAIHLHVRQNKLGEVFYSPIDVVLDDYNVPQPDVVFLTTDQANLVTRDGIMGVPTMVAEIISPSSVIRDRKQKYAIYERFGVAEYWLVDVAHQEIEIYALENGQYSLFSAASVLEGTLQSNVLPDLRLDLKTLFG